MIVKKIGPEDAHGSGSDSSDSSDSEGGARHSQANHAVATPPKLPPPAFASNVASRPALTWASCPGRVAGLWVAALTGNFDPGKSSVKKAAQLVARATMCAFVLNMPNAHPDWGSGQLISAMILNALILYLVIKVGIDAAVPSRAKMLADVMDHRPPGGISSCFGGLIALTFTIYFTLMPLTLVNPASVVSIYHQIFAIPFSLGWCSFMFILSDWVAASKLAIHEFGREACAMANPEYLVSDLESAGSGRAAPFTLIRFSQLFGHARSVVEAMNEILWVPSSIATILSFLLGIVLLIFYQNQPSMQVTAVVFTVIPFFLLAWLSSVGDVYLFEAQKIISPDVILLISQATDPDTASLVKHSLEHTQLAFSVVGIKLTSQRVLYLVFSFVVTVGITLATNPSAAQTLSQPSTAARSNGSVA